MGINTQSVESHLQFAESVAPDVTFLSDLSGEISKAYGIDTTQLDRGYFVIDKNRSLHYQYIATGTLLENQTATLLMEVDKMTGEYTGNPDDYTPGGRLVTHEDDGNLVGNHAFDFGLQAQCGANLTLYDQLKQKQNGVVVTFFRSPRSSQAEAMFAEFKANIDQFDRRGIGVIGITDSPPEKNMAFAQSLGVVGREIIFFYDKNGQAGMKYGVYNGSGMMNLGRHETAYFIIGKNGLIQYKHTGGMLDHQTESLLHEIDRFAVLPIPGAATP